MICTRTSTREVIVVVVVVVVVSGHVVWVLQVHLLWYMLLSSVPKLPAYVLVLMLISLVWIIILIILLSYLCFRLCRMCVKKLSVPLHFPSALVPAAWNQSWLLREISKRIWNYVFRLWFDFGNYSVTLKLSRSIFFFHSTKKKHRVLGPWTCSGWPPPTTLIPETRSCTKNFTIFERNS